MSKPIAQPFKTEPVAKVYTKPAPPAMIRPGQKSTTAPPYTKISVTTPLQGFFSSQAISFSKTPSIHLSL